jgi:hypothetical protein
MIHKHIYIWLTVVCTLQLTTSLAQVETDCDPTANLPITQGEVLFNYGSTTNAYSFRNRSSFTLGQPYVGSGLSQKYSSQTGFWARFLLPPQAPHLQVSQGDFPDRILLKWDLDPLSAPADISYVVTRDGAFLAEVDKGIFQFIDFNIQAGEFYEYGVYGRNQFGNGFIGKAIGFVSPNGVVSGKVETFSGNPVPGATVRLTPSTNQALVFNGTTDYICISDHPNLPTNMITLSAYVKIGSSYDRSGIIDLGSDINKNCWILTTPSSQGKGVVVGIGTGTAKVELEHEFVTDPNGWHQVTMVYAGSRLLLYIDGAFVSATTGTISNQDALFTIGTRRNQAGFYNGNIDDVRIYNRPLTSTEVLMKKDITESKATSGLVAYWKFDEGMGSKVFDITANDMHGYLRGPSFTSDAPSVTNAAITDVSGFYAIEGINYSKVQQFKAIPYKAFYARNSLEFNAAYQAYATLTDFDLPDTNTVEVMVHPFDLVSRQTILNKGTGQFELFVEGGNFKLTLNGETKTLGAATAVFQHLSLAITNASNQVKYYKNGTLANTLTFSSTGGSWTGSPWQLAAKGSVPTNYFTGLIDEVAFYDTTLTQAVIQLNASQLPAGGTDVGNGNLISYFSLDEGDGTKIYDYGPALSGFGTFSNTTFSSLAYNQQVTEHAFRPSERPVTINPSNTASPNIDFVDESTVTVSGVVRFENTFCYQDSVEILVNGQSAFPRIFTDENGRFVADFEPGSSVVLTPKFSDHKFYPAFFEVRKINRPIAGVLFQNQTKREIIGQMAGGHCRLSVIPEGAIVKVKVTALNDCFTREVQLTESNGKFKFSNLPPIPVAVAVTQHSLNDIYTFFQIQGGKETDLRYINKDTIDFIYIAPPNVYVQPFEANGCAGGADKMIDQSGPENGFKKYANNIRVYESYTGGDCYLDNFTLVINNNIADKNNSDTIQVDTSTYKHSYWAGLPNIVTPFKKFIQATAIVNGATATAVEEVVVLGNRSRESTFTTASPAMPLIILRDPPGDASFSELSEGATHCQTWSNSSFFNDSRSINVNLDLGTKVITYAGSPFGGIIMENEQVAEVDITASASMGIGTTRTAEVCVTNDKVYATSGDELVLNGESDLYVGAAVNFEYGVNDSLYFDVDLCQFQLKQKIRVWPDGFGTKYIYSEWQIEKDVIPSLELIGKTNDANNWRKIVEYNKSLKEKAKFVENITFDGLVTYTQIQETSKTDALDLSFDFAWEASFNEKLGFEVFDIGTTVTMGMTLSGGEQTTQSSVNTKNRAVSFTLADNEPNDNFSVDILDDPVFGTPVFKLRAGESMCPWEPGTQNREEVGFTLDKLTQVNIPENESALFNLTCTNLGQTGNDALVYELGEVTGTNQDGAVATVNGNGLSGLAAQYLPGAPVQYTLDVARPPVEYSLVGLGVFFASSCQLEHSLNLGYDLGAAFRPNAPTYTAFYKTEDLRKFYKEYKLNVEWVEPCSPIGISFPMQDWVMTPADGNNLFITLNEYIYDDPDLDIVRVQYRRTGGDGAWINIAELPASEFAASPLFKIVTWDMTELSDGAYEIRAVTQCKDVSLNPGISEIIKGRKETKAPALFGNPEPADGVLSPGDEISIAFTKRINCNKIFAADGIGSNININNLALLDITNGSALVDATIACKDEKIVIIPNVANQFIENHTLRAIVDEIEDLYGNKTEQIEWEFLVNRSTLFWFGGSVDEVVLEGNELVVTREIRNQAGSTVNFSFPDVPDWMEIFPREGSVAPGARQIVRFTFPSNLVNGSYQTVLSFLTVDGTEPLDVNLRVKCPEPEWAVNPADFSYSMNMTLELDVEGTLSTDQLDIVGAFVDGQLRGMAYIQYNYALDKHLAFLTVYSNQATGETVEFQVWDASDCLLYGETQESFPFVSDNIIGSPLEPEVLHTNNLLLAKVQINPGWNWISYNVNLPNPAINQALSSLTNPEGGLIKSQTAFSTHSTFVNGWVGNLTSLSHLTMYQYNSQEFDSLTLVGMPVDPSTPMPVVAGWNWIGYLPTRGLPVNTALQSLTPLNGDIVKGQVSFAQYVSGLGWVGNLSFLSPYKGYLLKLSNPGTLIYPDPSNVTASEDQKRLQNQQQLFAVEEVTTWKPSSIWTLNPGEFEYSMNIIAIVSANQVANILQAGDEIGAFVGNQVRGTATPVFIEALNAYMVFLTVYSDVAGEAISFKFFSHADQQIYPIVESNTFSINGLSGTVEQPVILTLGTPSSSTDILPEGWTFDASPNPASASVYFSISTPTPGPATLQLFDVRSQKVDEVKVTLASGANKLEWVNAASMPRGVYYATLVKENTVMQTKVLLIK